MPEIPNLPPEILKSSKKNKPVESGAANEHVGPDVLCGNAQSFVDNLAVGISAPGAKAAKSAKLEEYIILIRRAFLPLPGQPTLAPEQRETLTQRLDECLKARALLKE